MQPELVILNPEAISPGDVLMQLRIESAATAHDGNPIVKARVLASGPAAPAAA